VMGGFRRRRAGGAGAHSRRAVTVRPLGRPG
jgi:hypothetical protein